MVANVYDQFFTKLTLPEKVRISRYAETEGIIILSIEAETAGHSPENLKTVASSDITESDFPNRDAGELESIRKYYAAVEKDGVRYPPRGHTPDFSSNEREAASMVAFLSTAVRTMGEASIEKWNYPVRVNR